MIIGQMTPMVGLDTHLNQWDTIKGYEIEIHGTWIQYCCVRPGTVDLGYYYVTRKNWKSGYRILVYLKYPDTDYRGSRNAIIRLRETTVIGILLCYLPGYTLPL